MIASVLHDPVKFRSSGICHPGNRRQNLYPYTDPRISIQSIIAVPPVSSYIKLACKAQSAFMIDLNQVSLALRNCTANSLILLDEFGKGTIPADGAGLFCGVIKHLLNRGSQCPKVLAATHFHEVFQKDMLNPHTFPIMFFHMQVLFTSSNGNNLNPGDVSISEDLDSTDHEHLEPTFVAAPGEKITYLYRYLLGLCNHRRT